MDIRARINARKILLSYLYQHCFFCNLIERDQSMTDALFVDYIFKTDNEKFDIAKDELIEKIKAYTLINSAEEIKEFAEIFFDNWTAADIDYDYLLATAKTLTKYEKKIIQEVDAHASSFHYHDMDLIDQAIFLLGYIERKVMKTPKEVLLNEMIELAKRYSDEGSPKLINGIMHKVFTPEEK